MAKRQKFFGSPYPLGVGEGLALFLLLVCFLTALTVVAHGTQGLPIVRVVKLTAQTHGLNVVNNTREPVALFAPWVVF